MSVVEVIDRGVFEPCEVSLRISDDDTRVYSCESSLRLLPGRRLTALATSKGRKYVIKIFPERHRSLQEYDKELAGHELLREASIETATMVYHGSTSDDVKIVVYEYIDRARTLLEVFAKRPETRAQLAHLELFAQLLAQLHRRQLVHEDPHLGNFLLKGDVITVLDTGAVRRVGNITLTEKNYGLFVAQFPTSWNIESQFHHAYCGNKAIGEADHDRMLQQVRSLQRWREQHYLKKIYRECTAFQVTSSLFGKLVMDRDYVDTGLAELLDNPQSMFDGEDVQMLKEGNTSTVGVVKLKDRRFVIKRYNVKSSLHLLKLMFRESRASRSWRNAHRMLLRGFPTARPVALLECFKGRLKGISVFVMEYVEGVNSADYFLDPHIDRESKRAIAKNLLELIREIHSEGLIHGDLKSTNFIVSDQGLVIVDLDSMVVAGSHTNMKAVTRKELARFTRNWSENAEAKVIFDELMNGSKEGNPS